MKRIISIHEYTLKPGVDEAMFESVLLSALEMGLLQLPGLDDCCIAKGIKGTRRGQYVAVWIWESKEAWEMHWGTVDNPTPPEQYPENWRIWENQILTPFLNRDPDIIEYSSYKEITVR